MAAREYLRLAEQAGPPQRQDYQLKAVGALIKAGQIKDARAYLRAIDVRRLETSYTARKAIFGAQIALYEQQPTHALSLLNRLEPLFNLNPTLVAEVYWVRAQAELAIDNTLGAAKNLIRRERFIAAKQGIKRNQQELWDILESSSPTMLRDELPVVDDPVLRGWIDLALISIEYAANPYRLREELDNWQTSYPNHPAANTLLFAISAPTVGRIGKVSNIALLLPFTSQFEKPARAVYDGFLALHEANTDPNKPNITVYDIGADPALAPSYYQQAVRDGAQFVVGPLGRKAAEYVARSYRRSVPTLLLSYIDGVRPRANIYQFGLSPEDEARQVAERAYLDGHRLAAILHPMTPWGLRVATAFRTQWENLGGMVVESQSYQPQDSDYSVPLKQLLNIDASEARKNLLEIILKTKLKFDPRRREDVDFIFLAAYAQQGRLLKPQINFYQALGLPVYSTSHVFTGNPDPIYDTDLNGIMFGDMPWTLVGEGRILSLKNAIQGKWPNRRTQLDRLYALGLDAYGIIPHLERLGADPYARYGGVTGGLTMDSAGRIHRQLVWARFTKGVPKLLDTFYRYKGQWKVKYEAGSTTTSD